MNTNYDKIKSDLLDFGKRNDACIGQYQRFYKAESIEDVISVVKNNFKWCIQAQVAGSNPAALPK